MPEDQVLLVPIPDNHILSGSALLSDRETGRTKLAYGSDVWPFPEVQKGTRVLIYASDTGETKPSPFVTWEARFLEWVQATGTGQYPRDPKDRPPTTSFDTAFMGFYEIEGLRELKPPISVGELAKKDGKLREEWPPRRPYLIPAP